MASTYHKDKHDLGITRSNGDVIGMMLVQKNGTPDYKVFDSEALTPI